jgi:hypothetical protein
MVYTIPAQKSTYIIPAQATSNKTSSVTTKSITPIASTPAISSIAPGINSVSDIGNVGQQKVISIPNGTIVLQRIDDNKYYYIKNDNNNGYIAEVRSAASAPAVSVPTVTKFETVATKTQSTPTKAYTIPAKKYTIPTVPTAEKYTIPEQANKSSTISAQSKTPSIPSVSKSVPATSQVTMPALSKATSVPNVTKSVPTIPQVAQPALSSLVQKIPDVPNLHIQQVNERRIDLDEPAPRVQPTEIYNLDEPVPNVQPNEIYNLDGIRVDIPKLVSNIIKVDGISTIPKPKEAEPIDVYDENYKPVYIGVSSGEAKILDSFQQALANYHDTWPIYEDNKQQCIQDAALAIKLWRNELASDDDPSNDNWYKFARMATLSEEWHAIVVVSPNGAFAFPEKDHIFDPRDNIYRGTIRNFDSDSEYSIEIYDKFDTVTRTDENGNDYEETTWIDPNQSHVSQQFVPNSDTEAEGLKSSYNEVEQIKIDQLQNKRVDQENFQVIPDGETYYVSKTNPDYVISNWTYENVITGDMEKDKLQKMNPDGTVYASKEDENSYNKITVSNIDSSMTTKQVAFSLAKQIYGEDFSIPQMVDIYQLVQKYSTNGKFDINKLVDINKELGSTMLHIMSVGVLKPAIYDRDTKNVTPIIDYSFLETVYGIDKTIDLYNWAISDKNPVKDKHYIEGSYQCMQFSRDFVKASRAAGFDTYVIAVLFADVNGDRSSGHALVGLKIGDNIYKYDPIKNADISLSKNWELVDPTSKVTESLIKIPTLLSKDDNRVSNIMANSPNWIAVNETINQKLATGEFIAADTSFTMPMLNIFEPQVPSGTVTHMQDIDQSPVIAQNNFQVTKVVVTKRPDQIGADGSESLSTGKYQAYT